MSNRDADAGQGEVLHRRVRPDVEHMSHVASKLHAFRANLSFRHLVLVKEGLDFRPVVSGHSDLIKEFV